MKAYDFTKGPVLMQLIFFSGPIMLTNLLQVSYQFVGSLWIGNLLGARELGAAAVSGTIIFTILSFIIGINNATLTILSQQKGKEDNTGIARYLNAFIVLLTFLAVLLGIGGFFFSDMLLRLVDTPAEMIEPAKGYLQINFIGILFLLGYNFIGTVMRALGNSKTPLKFVFIAVVLNVFLDPLFMKVFNMGIEGAAYATILSQGISFLLGVLYSAKKKIIPYTLPSLPKFEEVRLI